MTEKLIESSTESKDGHTRMFLNFVNGSSITIQQLSRTTKEVKEIYISLSELKEMIKSLEGNK